MRFLGENVKASIFIAASLDGYIARENGDIDWLSEVNEVADGEDYGYQEFMDSVDVLVMGRISFEKVLAFGEWPYGHKRVVVLSSRSLNIPDDISETVEAQSWAAAELVEQLSKRGVKHLYIDGGKTIQGFLQAGLIQEIIITRIPILLGVGIPLFGPLKGDIRLKHLETRTFAKGLVQSRYEVKG